MVLRVMLLMFSIACLFGQLDDPSLRRIETRLTDVIQWERLWSDTSRGFREPPDGSAELTVSVASDGVAYCSQHLGTCAAYRVETSRNWERSLSVPCCSHRTDEDALLAFVSSGRRAAANSDQRRPVAIGPGGLSGTWTVNSPARWRMTIKLEDRGRIVERYKQLRPSEADSLRTWLRKNYRDAGYRSITFACFKPSDPVLYLYGDRGTEGSMVISLFWDKGREEWIEAGMLARNQGTETFEALRSTIQAIACDTIRFD